eukprot:965128-Pyramimonas_sp.AAC.1
MDAMVSNSMRPRQGMPAGSSTAPFGIKLYCTPAVNICLEQGFSPSLAVHVGDFSLNGRHPSVAGCVLNVALALSLFSSTCCRRLSISIFELMRFCAAGASSELAESAA